MLQSLGVSIVGRQLEHANLVYGLSAAVVVLLGWLYLSSQLVLYAAEINVVLARRLWPAASCCRRSPSRTGALTALARPRSAGPSSGSR